MREREEEGREREGEKETERNLSDSVERES